MPKRQYVSNYDLIDAINEAGEALEVSDAEPVAILAAGILIAQAILELNNEDGTNV